MPLPILQPSHDASPETLVRLFHRTELHWVRHVGEETQLEVGTAFTNPELPTMRDSNLVMEAALPAGVTAEAAYDEVEAHFSARGVRCLSWILNPSAPPEQTRLLVGFLSGRGWRNWPLDILYLAGQKPSAIKEVGGLTIIPARASFRHTRALAEQIAAEWREPPLADSWMRHLDDPHWDALVALRDGEAVAGVGVLAVGDVGRITYPFVVPALRRQGLGRTMMSRALEICARSLFKHVMLGVAPNNPEAIAMYQSLGFRKIGEVTAYLQL
jgi:ribosomal protein S18 acetylase RimI-like enzyme